MLNTFIMKKNITIFSFFLSICLVAFKDLPDVMDSNGKNGYCGSPSEPSCNAAGCHNQFTTNTGGGSVAISSSNMPGNQYQPGQTYHMMVTVAKTGCPVF